MAIQWAVSGTSRRHLRLPVLCALLAATLAAQEPDAGLERLAGLLATPVIAATRQWVPIRESPGIITVLDREEIRASGARDLMELLQTVPGLDFGSDTNGVLGIGVRGNWGHDGKVLLLVDGLELNEPLYGTLQFGGHYPIGNVDRVEIVRGPGSAVYGGFAELAVIQVFSRAGADTGGVSGDLWLGRMAGADLTARQGQVTFGKAWGSQDFSLSYSRGDVPEGSGPWPITQGALDSGRDSRFHQDFLNLGYAAGNLRLRYIRDHYYVADNTREFNPDTAANRFPGEFLGIDYTWTLGDWTVKPEFQLKQQSPWNYTDAQTDRDTRGVGRLLATWKATGSLNLSAGFEATQDDANIYWGSLGHRETYVYQNKAALFQMLWALPFGNLDAGVRNDRNSEFGSATSPRLAYTYATPDWHFKVLAAGAFRAPSMENLFVNPGLRPERTRSLEAEFGIALGRHSYLSANLFAERVHEPISYANPAPAVNTYMNFDQVGSRGLEVDFQGHYRDLTVRSSFTLRVAEDVGADFYAVPGQEAEHVGFPRAEFRIQAQWRFLPGWSLNPDLLVQGPRYAYLYQQTLPSRLGGSTRINLFLTRRISDALEAGLRISNLTGADTSYAQPYGFPGQGGNPPLPGPGREVDLRITFQF